MDPELFKKGLVKYVLDFKGKNSDVDQALDVFTKKANSVDPTITSHGFEIQKIMKSWLDQRGVPLIVAKRNDWKKKLIFHQAIFKELDLSKQNEVHVNDQYWLIPLSCTTEKESKFDEVTPRVWLNSYQQQWGPPGEFNKKDWFLCNLEFNVPGRVLYDKKTWNSIRKFLIDESKFKKINVLTRARLVSDMFTLAEAGQLTYEMVLRTMEYLQYEEELIPWMIALKEIDRIWSRLLGRDLALLEQYEKFFRMILKPGFRKLVVNNFLQDPAGDSVENKFQMLFTEISCKFDFEECSQRSSELFQLWRKISKFPVELEIEHRLHKVVLCEQVKHGNQEKWTLLWNQYDGERRQSWKEDILHAFGCLKKIEDLQSHSEGEPSVLSYLRILFDATNELSHYDEILEFANSKNIALTDELIHRSMDNANRNIIWGQKKIKDLKHSFRNSKLKKLIKTLKKKFKL